MPPENFNFEWPMKFQRFNKFHGSLVVLTLFFGWIIWFIFNDRAAELQSEQSQFLASQSATWLQADSERALTVSQNAQLEAAAQADKLVEVLGGPLSAAMKNPELNLRQMLTQIASACAPTNAEVSVSVDRFTEFDVAFVLHDALTFSRLARITKRFLTNSVPYVHSLRFIQGNGVLAELNEAAIESVTNWNEVSIASVQELLLADDSRTQRLGATVADPAEKAIPPDEEYLNADQIKISAAQKNFRKHFSDHIRAINQLMTDLNQAVRLDSITSQNQLSTRIHSLDEFPARLTNERDFFMNQADDLARLLQDQGSSPLIITILERSQEKRNAAEAPALTDWFDAITSQQAQTRDFLTSMENDWGDWNVTSRGNRIQFTTSAAKDDYEKQWGLVQSSMAWVKASIRSWENAEAAK
jgi:hypothetical protein